MIRRLCGSVSIRIQGIIDKIMASARRRCISNTNFSIISNNCWAGYVYRRYGLPYLTPTVGLYFFADDFVKLCSDVKGYMSKKLVFISYTESKYKDIIEKRNQVNIPIARLGDIEVIFLHYSSPEEAAEKWYRRVNRINYDNLIFKFTKMNLCTDEHLVQFDKLNLKKKMCFVPVNFKTNIKSAILLEDSYGEEVENDTKNYSKYVDLIKMINSEFVCGKNMKRTQKK